LSLARRRALKVESGRSAHGSIVCHVAKLQPAEVVRRLSTAMQAHLAALHDSSLVLQVLVIARVLDHRGTSCDVRTSTHLPYQLPHTCAVK
jgi:hypothetical protein